MLACNDQFAADSKGREFGLLLALQAECEMVRRLNQSIENNPKGIVYPDGICLLREHRGSYYLVKPRSDLLSRQR